MKRLLSILLAIIFLLSGSIKAALPAAFLLALTQLFRGRASALIPWMATVIVVFELGVAGLLLSSQGRRVGAGLALTGLILFTTALILLPAGTSCGCFGDIHLPWLQVYMDGPGTILRNVILIGISGWLFFSEDPSSELSTIDVPKKSDPNEVKTNG